MWAQERLQNEEFLSKSVRTDDNVADVMAKHSAAARTEELLSELRVRRCTRGLVVEDLVATVSGPTTSTGAPTTWRRLSLACTRGHVACRGYVVLVVVLGAGVLLLAQVLSSHRHSECQGSLPKWSEEVQIRASRVRKQVETPSDSRSCWMPLGPETSWLHLAA